MSHNNDVKIEVIIPGNEKNQEFFLMVYKGSCNRECYRVSCGAEFNLLVVLAILAVAYFITLWALQECSFVHLLDLD